MYALSQLETALQRDVFWLLRQCEQATGKPLVYDADTMDAASYVRFIKWYNEAYDAKHPVPNRRKLSTSQRIEVMYKTKYRCGMCGDLLKPSCEIDHIKSLDAGGLDEWSNLWALCRDCHGEKTRVGILRRNKVFQEEFEKRAEEIEKKAFKRFHFNGSKYFTT